MKKNKFNTPILFIVFNRPDTTKSVFETIRKIKPKELFIASDGPRVDRIGEDKLCNKVRKITEKIDWTCKVHRLYRNSNLGCGKSVSGAINWFFKNVEQGIILEDDCVPNISFFYFCEQMLNKYRNNTRVMHISGDNYQPKIYSEMESYYFSIYPNIWGWATWRRAWEKYSFDMRNFNIARILNFAHKVGIVEFAYWICNFTLVKFKLLDTWDYQWIHTLIENNACSIIPNRNLVKNIGFDSRATHTKADLKIDFSTKEISFPLIHPEKVLIDKIKDKYTSKKIFHINLLMVLYQIFKITILMIKFYLRKLRNKFNYLFSVTFQLILKFSDFKTTVSVWVEVFGKEILIPLNHSLPTNVLLNQKYSLNLNRIARFVYSKYQYFTAIDVGANIGDSVTLIKKDAGARVICFEGDKEYIKYLRTNIQGYDDVYVYEVMLGEKSGYTLANIDSINGTSNLSKNEISKQKIRIEKIDNMLGSVLFNNLKLLKIDTDGYDLKVLQGARKMVLKHKPVLYFEMFEEMLNKNGNSVKQTLEFLSKNEYLHIISYDNYGNLHRMLKLPRIITQEYINSQFSDPRAIYYDIIAFHNSNFRYYNQFCKSELKFYRYFGVDSN